jgi:hypothetical protein
LVFVFDLDHDDTDEDSSNEDDGWPQELAKEMLYFWTKQFHFSPFRTTKAFFGSHDSSSSEVKLFVPVTKIFCLPDSDLLSKFIEYVNNVGPDTFQEGRSGMLHGKFLDLSYIELL